MIEILEPRELANLIFEVGNYAVAAGVEVGMLEVETRSSMLPGIEIVTDRARTWFSRIGCVVREGEERLVFVGGTLVARFDESDVVARSLVIVGLAEDGQQHIGKLAAAFSVCDDTVRNLQKRYAKGGAAGLVPAPRHIPHAKPKLNGRQRRDVERLFERGKRPFEVVAQVEAKYGVKRSVVYAMWNAWRARKAQAPVVEEAPAPEQKVIDAAAIEHAAESTGQESAQTPPAEETEQRIADAPLEVGSTSHVQHLGIWLMLAAVKQLGLYDNVAKAAKAKRTPTRGLRLALDALIGALAIGERCVEGVRRLETPTANLLLRAKAVPSAPWVRAILAQLASACGLGIQDAMAKQYLEVAAATNQVAAFYVDNHLRTYTGKYTVRKGWRMQDKRVRPGISDFYVHDLDGRPVLRVTDPAHGHLTDFLHPIADQLRRALGSGAPILLAFDRGGAFPEAMAELRDAGVHFVTYERRPYALLASTAFDKPVRIGKEVYALHESNLANLGKKRGRVRRIAVLTPEGKQINLLATSDLPAETLLAIMLGRWWQENGFKHGNERWGINQLDSRKVVHYAPGTIIPNPARRRLDDALRIAKVREGDARCKLAALQPDNETRRAKLELQLEEAMRDQADLLAQRPSVPKHVELSKSELADTLVHHTPDYKTLLDAVRIACANAESELASMLAPKLARPREAKKLLANLFAAPGNVRVTERTIHITLAPAATDRERAALAQLVRQLDDAELVLPGDPRRRHLRLRIPK